MTMIDLPDHELYIHVMRDAAAPDISRSAVKITHRPTGLVASASDLSERVAYDTAYRQLCAKVYATHDPVTRRAAIDPCQNPVRELRNPITLSTVRIDPPFAYTDMNEYSWFVIKFARYCQQVWDAHHGDPARVEPVDVNTADSMPVDHAFSLDLDLQRLEERYGVYAVGQAAMRRYANHCGEQ